MPSVRIPLAILTGALLAAAWAEEGEANVTIDQVPKAVKTAILAAADGAKVAEIEKQTVKGKVYYEVSWIGKDKKEVEVLIAEDGTVLKPAAEEEHEGKTEKGEAAEHEQAKEKEKK